MHLVKPVAKPLRVLVISLFHPELIRGGAQQIAYEHFQELQQTPGVEPTLLASTDSTYPALFKSGACITGFDNRPSEFLFLMQDYDYWWHKTSSPRMVAAFTTFLHEIQPDIIHFHHFFTFGIDFLTLTRAERPGAKIIFTFHEFMAICAANGQMVRLTDNSLCTRASAVRCHQCFPDHPPETFLLRRMWMLRHLAAVDSFSCPSQFMLKFYEDFGIPAAKLHHIPNGQRRYGALQPAGAAKKNRFGFFGQILDHKGVHILLRAVSLLRAQNFTDFTVQINGGNIKWASAPVREEIETFMESESLLPPDQKIVTFNGPYHTENLAARMAQIDWVVVPSTWWEIFGLVISEAWMFGKPVIAPNHGGPAERITHNQTGLIFEHSDPTALSEILHRAATEKNLWQKLRANLPEPPGRAEMVAGFLGLYRQPAEQ
jgi:glycosyltransferase involved in cell wall biosynthesis